MQDSLEYYTSHFDRTSTNMTEAASLNFGPAWLRDSFTSNTVSEGPPGTGGSGGTSNHNSHQTNSGWDIATSRSSHGHGAKSNISQASNQSTFQMNLHVGGQQSSSASSVLSAMKLGINQDCVALRGSYIY